MALTTQVTFKKTETIISIDTLKTLITIHNLKILPKKLNENSIILFYNQKELVFVGLEKDLHTTSFDTVIEIHTQQDIEPIYLKRMFIDDALEKGRSLNSDTEPSVPTNISNTFRELFDSILLVIEKMGYPIETENKKKAKPAKARHKWTKEVSKKEFYIDTRDSIATVMWIKRNQMLIKKGATMMKEAPLNKDGSVGFSAKMGDKIRSENSDKFQNFKTTEDIILKSVNEVGLFLYFAGTNSWLEMIDTDGRTLNEWTVVE